MKALLPFIRTAPLIALAMVLTMSLSTPALAALDAQNTGLSAAAPEQLARTCATSNCIADIIGRLIGFLLGFVGVVLLVMLLWAGFLWMTAGGEKEKVDRARSMIANAVAGIAIIGLAYVVTGFVLDTLDTALTGSSGEQAPAPATNNTTNPPP